MNVAIIGCGLIGRKRAFSCGQDHITATYDVDALRSMSLAADLPQCRAVKTLQEIWDDPTIQAVVVATMHDALAPVTRLALEAGKHVLVEKPGARNIAEFGPVEKKAAETGKILKVGFNHRFHPAIWKAHELVQSGALGSLMFIRGFYGHGGRLGYEKEWRAQPERSGGGELIDQGMHLIDLSRWFLGDFAQIESHIGTYFWDMPVEDNVFLMMHTAAGQSAWLHASWSEWKNCFRLEIYGKNGKLLIEGLGRSYGVERLTHYMMKSDMKPPECASWEFPGEDESWAREWDNFRTAILKGVPVCGDGKDGLEALRIVERVYEKAKAVRA
jgi:predicted dehydrogenase